MQTPLLLPEPVHSLERCETKPKSVFGQMQPKLLSFDPTHELSNNAIRFEGSFLDMNTAESSTNLIAMPGLAPHRDNVTSLFQQPRRLLDVCDVAKWLGVSKGWVRDHASGRREPKLQAIKLGSRKGKGLWKFREEEVQQFLCDRNFR